jgi:hypothetical protein
LLLIPPTCCSVKRKEKSIVPVAVNTSRFEKLVREALAQREVLTIITTLTARVREALAQREGFFVISS